MALSTSDPWYVAETTPPEIDVLAGKLRAAFSGAEVGTRGNTVHVRGYHRSRNWVLHSPDCPDRTYSVTETPGNRSGGDGDWVCALDFGGVPQATLIEVCRRVDAAVRAGRLEKVTEWYGNLGGDDRVDGFNNILNRLASSDSSHLFHLHLSFDRGRANEDHSDVLAVMTGEGEMELTDKIKFMPVDGVTYTSTETDVAGMLASTNAYVIQTRNLLRQQGQVIAGLSAAVADLTAKVAALGGGTPAPGGGATSAEVQEIVHGELGKLEITVKD